MNKSPTLSVIVPTYNCLPYLEGCIASIDQQQVADLEIIIVDDGSDDGSRSWLLQVAEKRDDIIVLFENNIGPGGARNTAAQVAKGEYLAFLDADDRWTANKLASQLAYLQCHKNVGLSFTNYQHIDEQTGQPIVSCFDYWPEFNHTLDENGNVKGYHMLKQASAVLYKENVVGTSSVICRRDAFIQVQGFDISLPSASDWDVWLKLAAIGDVAFTSDVKMHYLMRRGSVSSNVLKRIKAMETIAQRHALAATQQQPNIQQFVSARLSDAYAEHYAQQNQYFATLWQQTKGCLRFPTMRRFKELVRTATMIKTAA